MNDLIKKINWKSLLVHLLVCVLSTILSELGIGCYYGCGLGTDPISVFVDGLHAKTGLSYGDISTICNVIQAILIYIFERKYLGPGTLIGVLIGGPFIDIFETLVRTNFPLETTTMAVRAIILVVGLITSSIGYGLGIACDLGIGCFQLWPIWLSDITHLEIKYTQTISDAAFLIIGWLLGGIVGIGTVVGTLLTGYILEWTLKKSDKPLKSLGPIINK